MVAADAVSIVPLSFTSLGLLGCLGAFFVEALKVVAKLRAKQLPDAFDLAVSVILIALGGGVAMVYYGQVESVMIAVQIGATAPAIIGAWSSSHPMSGKAAPGAAHGGGKSFAPTVPSARGSRLKRALSWVAVRDE
jgi:hypothetical protein